MRNYKLNYFIIVKELKIMLKKVLIFLLVICLSIQNLYVGVYAAPSDDYKTFSQLDPRWSGYVYGGGRTLGQAGCFITSFAVVMAYANPELRDVEKFNPQILASKCSFAGAGLYSSSINNADSTFHWESDMATSGGEDAEKKIKELLNQDKYVVVRAGPPIASSTTHFSPIVGWNASKDEPIIMDVAGGAHPEWSQWAPHVDRLDICRSDKNGSRDALSGNVGDSIQENAPDTEEERQELEELIREWDLIGMPVLEGLPDQDQVEFADRDELSLTEKINLSHITAAKANNSIMVSESLGKVLMFIGILVILYSVFLLIALLFDWVNGFIDFSLLKILTLGRYRLVSREYFEENKLIGYDKYTHQTNVTPLSCFIRIIVVFIIGILLVSGKTQYWVVEFTYSVMDWFREVF